MKLFGDCVACWARSAQPDFLFNVWQVLNAAGCDNQCSHAQVPGELIIPAVASPYLQQLCTQGNLWNHYFH